MVFGCVPGCTVRYSSSTNSGNTVRPAPVRTPVTASGGQSAPVIVAPAPAREQHRAGPSAPVVAAPAPAATRSPPVVAPPVVQRAPAAVPVATPQPEATPAAAAAARPRTVSDPSATIAPNKPREVPELPKAGSPTRVRAGAGAPSPSDAAETAKKKPAAVQAPSQTEVTRSRKISGQ